MTRVMGQRAHTSRVRSRHDGLQDTGYMTYAKACIDAAADALVTRA